MSLKFEIISDSKGHCAFVRAGSEVIWEWYGTDDIDAIEYMWGFFLDLMKNLEEHGYVIRKTSEFTTKDDVEVKE